jgi:Spy/CpxP family protein refolding chaperone
VNGVVARVLAGSLVCVLVSSDGVSLGGLGGGLAAQDLPARGTPNPDVMTVQQVEQYFDQVVLHQARSNLQLNDDQFLRFGAALRRLQAARRQQLRRRMAVVRDLNALTAASALDEPAVTAKLKELDAVSAEASREVREAYGAIDGVLTLRQRARFRVFEEMMERRKLDLLARARRAGRQASPPN